MATLEQIDKLRERANVGYEEAKEAMMLCDDDFLSALIYLEKMGKVKGEKKPEQPKWTQHHQQQPWYDQTYRENYTYPGYYRRACNMQYRMEKRAQKWAEKMNRRYEKIDRRLDDERAADFWKEFCFALKRFAKLAVYGICVIPIMFFAMLAALFTKFRVKIERNDGQKVQFNDTLDKIARFADDATGYKKGDDGEAKQENPKSESAEYSWQQGTEGSQQQETQSQQQHETQNSQQYETQSSPQQEQNSNNEAETIKATEATEQ